MKLLIFALALVSSIYYSTAQLNEGGLPLSFKLNKQGAPVDQAFNRYRFDTPDLEKINAEDLENSLKGKPYRIAVNQPVNLNIATAGTWTTLENGDKIWRLGIQIPEAIGLGLYFNQAIQIPEGGKLYAYNENHSQFIGAYTASTPEFTAMEMIQGEVIILEYYAPKSLNTLPIIDIKSVAFFYRGVSERLDLFRSGRPADQNRADACQVDVACAEINGWEPQRDAVVRYTFEIGGSTFLCSGAVVNNTSNDCKPYILSANHCGEPTSSSDIANHVWYFNYQRPTCSPGNTSPYNGAQSQTISGGAFRASSRLGTHLASNSNQVDGCDFLLVELNQNIPQSFNAYYAGWTRGTASSSSGVGIHHPSGHEKKVSTYTSSLSSTTYNGGWSNAHWQVHWVSTTNGHGVTEGGSSGSPIFNSSGNIMGHLSGGSSACSATSSPDLYGKMNKAWDQDGTTANAQLKPWLDPTNTGQTTINGTYYPCSSSGGGDPDYCEASSTDCDEYISNLTIGGISNNSSCMNYQLYWENNPVGLEFGASYLLELTTAVIGSNSIGYDGDQIAVWIDWNGDGDFTDNNETVLAHTVASNSTTMPLQAVITVPSNAVNGETRMRARVMYDVATEGNITPCGTSAYGDVEDYVLNLSDGTNSIANATPENISVYPNPTEGILKLDLTNIDHQNSQITITDLTGKIIYTSVPNGPIVELNLSNESKGLYFVQVSTEKNHLVKKVVLR